MGGGNKKVNPEPHHFSLKKMQETFAFIKKGLQIFEDIDPNGQNFPKVMHVCHKAFAS